jgi:PEP-CTERM motif
MFMHSKGLFALASLLLFCLAGATSAPAYAAGLDGSTVSAAFWLPVPGVTPPTNPPPTVCTTTLACEIPNYIDGMGNSVNSPSPMAPENFQEGAASGSTISVGDTQIVITNELANEPLCSTALPCTDAFVGFSFAFTFSGGVHITDVTVDSGSSADFLPVSGGLTFNPTDIFVNLVGDSPAAGDKLILDVTAAGSTPVIPEPSTWAMMLLGFAGLGFIGYRRLGGHGRAAHVG